jgi:arsenate reductase
MADFTIVHNQRCSTSRGALDALAAAGARVDVIRYLDTPLDEGALHELLAKLEDPPTSLVRRDPLFAELGLTDADVATANQVAAVLAAHPALMQRPVLVRGNRAIIGRPRDRVAAFIDEGAVG